eukprot:scaffold27768_cov107-Isochrysis_galbana.AAC.1
MKAITHITLSHPRFHRGAAGPPYSPLEPGEEDVVYELNTGEVMDPEARYPPIEEREDDLG